MEQITREELEPLAIRIEFTNLATGEKRFELWKKVETNIPHTYQDSKGNYYTQGKIGWMNVSAFVITPLMVNLKDIGREMGYNPHYVAPARHRK